ncbi:MAG: GNAT family N-acetyltransferase, partial [Cyanobacteria bacterium SIG30]|nr:GNAT family N-acetyltransferase [Cyanobacteria bacterium SIG30]
MWIGPNSEEENFSIILKDSNKMIGTVGNMLSIKNDEYIENDNLKKYYKENKIIYEIGIVVGREYWGKGIATEALKLTMEYLFVQKGADAVLGLHYSENLASKKMQEKCNLKEICRKEVKDK